MNDQRDRNSSTAEGDGARGPTCHRTILLAIAAVMVITQVVVLLPGLAATRPHLWGFHLVAYLPIGAAIAGSAARFTVPSSFIALPVTSLVSGTCLANTIQLYPIYPVSHAKPPRQTLLMYAIR